MIGRSKRLLLMALTLTVGLLYFGCSQPDDILSPVSTTRVTLNSQRLPTTPDGMAYSLWAVNDLAMDRNSGEYVFIGSFTYNNDVRRYYDLDGTEMEDGGVFMLTGDLLSYSEIAISIEDIADMGTTPGPIMLVADVNDPEEEPTKMYFWGSDLDEKDQTAPNLWDGTVFFNMETVSDGDRDALDGYGVWFSSYQLKTGTFQDTARLDSFTLDTIYKPLLKQQDDDVIVTGIDVTVGTFNAGTGAWDGADIQKPYGLDTLDQLAIRWNWITETSERKIASIDGGGDTTWLGYPQTTPRFYFWFDPAGRFSGDSVDIIYDHFYQSDFNLLVVPGWTYKGWVVSPLIDSSAVGEFSMPGYAPNTSHYEFMPGLSGGLLSTGKFTDIAARDLEDPYLLGGGSARVPNIPGEDFLTNLPSPLVAPLKVSADDVSKMGSVFITLEPDNFVTDTTNFPLIYVARRIPVTADSLVNVMEVEESWKMKGWSATSTGLKGFPFIEVTMERF